MFSDNPDIQINMDPRDNFIILTKNNYKGYIVIPEDISEHPVFTINSQRFRDLICLWVLAEHGGIWINPTTHQEHGGVNITSSLELAYHSNKEFNSYYTKNGIDTRYMECKKGTPFISAWRNEYSQIAQFPSVERYLESRSVGDIRYEHMDPLMVACKLILPEYIKNIELRS